MATINQSQIDVGTSGYDLQKSSRKLQKLTLEGDYFLNALRGLGVINEETDLSKESGTSLVMYNNVRHSSLGNLGDVDAYAAANGLKVGDRSVSIRKHFETVRYALDKTERQQIAEFKLSEPAVQAAVSWSKEITLHQVMAQLTSNTATTRYVSSAYDYAVTNTAEIKKLNGHNDPVAPSTVYRSWGNEASGGISADQSVSSSNKLKVKDFLNARRYTHGTQLGVPNFYRLQNPIQGMKVDAVALVGTTGMNQLKFEDSANYNFTQVQYATLQSGKQLSLPFEAFTIPGTGMLFMEMPDEYFSRGVHSGTSAEVANTRRCVIVGANAVDFAMGKGFGAVGGWSVRMDDEHKKLNDEGFLKVEINCGFKKVQIAGTGAYASTKFDNSIYTITHYSDV